jgi:hypothetical protein
MDSCSICLENVHKNKVELACRHSFHKTCIVEWSSYHSTCPYCRHPFDICDYDMKMKIIRFINVMIYFIMDLNERYHIYTNLIMMWNIIIYMYIIFFVFIMFLFIWSITIDFIISIYAYFKFTFSVFYIIWNG